MAVLGLTMLPRVLTHRADQVKDTPLHACGLHLRLVLLGHSQLAWRCMDADVGEVDQLLELLGGTGSLQQVVQQVAQQVVQHEAQQQAQQQVNSRW